MTPSKLICLSVLFVLLSGIAHADGKEEEQYYDEHYDTDFDEVYDEDLYPDEHFSDDYDKPYIDETYHDEDFGEPYYDNHDYDEDFKEPYYEDHPEDFHDHYNDEHYLDEHDKQYYDDHGEDYYDEKDFGSEPDCFSDHLAAGFSEEEADSICYGEEQEFDHLENEFQDPFDYCFDEALTSGFSEDEAFEKCSTHLPEDTFPDEEEFFDECIADLLREGFSEDQAKTECGLGAEDTDFGFDPDQCLRDVMQDGFSEDEAKQICSGSFFGGEEQDDCFSDLLREGFSEEEADAACYGGEQEFEEIDFFTICVKDHLSFGFSEEESEKMCKEMESAAEEFETCFTEQFQEGKGISEEEAIQKCEDALGEEVELPFQDVYEQCILDLEKEGVSEKEAEDLCTRAYDESQNEEELWSQELDPFGRCFEDAISTGSSEDEAYKSCEKHLEELQQEHINKEIEYCVSSYLEFNPEGSDADVRQKCTDFVKGEVEELIFEESKEDDDPFGACLDKYEDEGQEFEEAFKQCQKETGKSDDSFKHTCMEDLFGEMGFSKQLATSYCDEAIEHLSNGLPNFRKLEKEVTCIAEQIEQGLLESQAVQACTEGVDTSELVFEEKKGSVRGLIEDCIAEYQGQEDAISECKEEIRKDFESEFEQHRSVNRQEVETELASKRAAEAEGWKQYREDYQQFQRAVETGDDEQAIVHAKSFLSEIGMIMLNSIETLEDHVEASPFIDQKTVEEIRTDLEKRADEINTAMAAVTRAQTKDAVKKSGALLLTYWDAFSDSQESHKNRARPDVYVVEDVIEEALV